MIGGAAERVDVEAVRARCEAATPGGWWVEPDYDGGGFDIFPSRGPSHVALSDKGAVLREADAEFIAAARSDLPRALDEIERLSGLLKAMRILADGMEAARNASAAALAVAERDHRSILLGIADQLTNGANGRVTRGLMDAADYMRSLADVPLVAALSDPDTQGGTE